MLKRTQLVRVGCVLVAAIAVGCSKNVAGPAEEVLKPLFEEQYEPPPDECFSGMACAAAWEGDDWNGNGTYYTCDTEPQCVLRPMTAQELQQMMLTVNRLPANARSWVISRIQSNHMFVWDLEIFYLSPIYGRVEADYHRDGPHAESLHVWATRVMGPSAGLGLALCHEWIHATRLDLSPHSSDFNAAVNECVAAISP